MPASGRPRFVVFVDDADTLSRALGFFGDGNVVALSARSLGRGVQTVRREQLERTLAELRRAHEVRPFAGVVNFREPYVLAAGRVSTLLGLPGALPEPLRARDKLLMKDVLRQAVRCADCRPIRTEEDLSSLPEALFPVVLKPRYGFASLCTVRVDDPRMLRREYREKRDKLATTHIERVDPCIPEAPELVLESFVGGTEHTVESFVANGEVVLQIVSDKAPMVPPHFVETGDVMPSVLDEGLKDELRSAARRGIAALGVAHGWTHAEIKLWRGEAWVMEIAARMGGGYTRELVQAAYGLDMLGALFEYARSGRVPVLPAAPAHARGTRFIAPGVSLVWDTRKGQRSALQGARVVERESSHDRRGIVLGAPYSYDGTMSAHVLRASSPEEVERVLSRVRRDLAPRFVELPVPRSWYRAYLRTKRALDVVRRRW